MSHYENHFKNHRKQDIFYQSWIPDDEIKAILLVVHGLAEHSGRYENVVKHFVPKGYAVYAYDHPGHGRSPGDRCYIDRFDDFLQTLECFSGLVRRGFPDTPVYLIGHSMGGAISAAYLTTRQEEFSGAILSGPAVKISDDMSKLTLFMGKVLSALAPKSGLLQLEADGISRDPEVVKTYENDPLVYRGKITARLAGELFSAIKRTAENAHKITLPLLIVQGGEDKLVPPDGASLFHERIGSADKSVKIYDGLYHEIFNEPEREEVLTDVENWLEHHLSSGG
jgi:acylglycerol lipase